MRPLEPIANYIQVLISFINNLLIPLLLTGAFFFFVFGVYKYFIEGGTSEEKRGEGQKFVLWGVIAFAVIFSVWGLVGILVRSLGFSGYETHPPIPRFPSAPTLEHNA